MQKTKLAMLAMCTLLSACGGGGGGTSDAAGGPQSPIQDVPDPVTPAAPAPGNPTTPGGGTVTPATPSDPVTQPTGGGTTPVTPPAVVTPPPPPPTAALTVFSFDTASNTISTNAGVLQLSNDQISIFGLDGTVSPDGTMVTFESGGQITLAASGTDDVSLFQFEPTVGSPTFGVFGQKTDFSTFTPGATATYSGTGMAVVQIIDGNNIYDLTGDLAADVRFTSGLVDVAISGLQGERTDGLSAPVQVTDAAEIGVTGGQLVNGTFSGGVATFTSTEIGARLSASHVLTSTGGLFGDSAQEIGGIFLMDDSGQPGNLLVQGQYVGN